MNETAPPTPTPTAATSSRRVLITGASGQDGHYLCQALLAEGAEVFGLISADGRPAPAGLHAIPGDVRDEASLRKAVEIAAPTEIYNLAAITFVPSSWENPDEIFDVNTEGVRRLLTAIADSAAPIRFCQASTAEIFGAGDGHPQDENTPQRPHTPYGISKSRAHLLVARAREEHGLFACSAILFNHESPLRPPGFVTRKISRAAARIARGVEKTLTLGNLSAGRDWGYAPEYVEAMRRMLGAGQPRDYVIATGRGATVRDFVALAFAHVGLRWQDHVLCDDALLRSADAQTRVGNPARILRDLGWKARTTLEELVAIMVDADLARIDANEHELGG